MKKRIVLIVMCLFAAILNLHAQKLTGRDLAQKVKDRPDGDTRCFEMSKGPVSLLGIMMSKEKMMTNGYISLP